MSDRLTLHDDFICKATRLRDLPEILRNGERSVDAGGPTPLGAPDYLAKRAAVSLPPPYRNPLTSYVALRFTPLSPSSLAVLTGWNGAELVPPRELVFLVTQAQWVQRLQLPYLFSDLGLVARGAKLFADLSRLDVIDRERLSSGKFDTSEDPVSPHRAEAEFLIWNVMPPRAIREIVCSHERGVAPIDAQIAAAGRSGAITVRADSKFFFGRS